MAPNHGGDPLGSILGPMGSYWVKKWVKNIKNYHAPNSNFWLLRGRRFLAKNGSYGYGAKSRWGPLGSILGPMESHWVQKMGQNRKKLPCLKIRILSIPVIDFSQKNRSYRYGAKLRWGPLGSILGPMGSHWVQKMGQNRTKLPSPKIWIIGHQFLAKNRSYGYGAKSRWEPVGSILGPMGPKNGSKP